MGSKAPPWLRTTGKGGNYRPICYQALSPCKFDSFLRFFVTARKTLQMQHVTQIAYARFDPSDQFHVFGAAPEARNDGIARLLMVRVVVTLAAQTGGRIEMIGALYPQRGLFEF